MSFIVKINNVDRSDYVIDCGLVPALERNRDWTPILSEIDITISAKVPVPPGEGQKITIASSANPLYPFYIGLISERKYDYQLSAYRLQVISILSKLARKKTSYYNLHNEIAMGATLRQYNPSDNTGYPAVQLLWLLDRMFFDVDILVSLPNENIIIQTITFGGVERLMQLKHLRIDENMLYAVNQNVATFHTTIEADGEKRLLVPSYWDIIQAFCSGIGTAEGFTSEYIIGFHLRWSTSGAPETLTFVQKSSTPININDDVVYNKEVSNIVGDENGVSYNVMFTERSYYALTTERIISEHEEFEGDGGNSVDYPMNFMILYEKYWEAEGYSFLLHDYPLYVFPPRAFLDNKIKAATQDFDVNKWRSDTTIHGTAKEVLIDVDNYEAEITEELE